MKESRLNFSVSGIPSDSRLYELVNASHRMLDDLMGPFGAEINENWSLSQDAKNRPLIQLNLSDFKGRAEAKFAPDELENPRQMYDHLYRIWGDLLEDRSHKQLRDLLEPENGTLGNGNAT